MQPGKKFYVLILVALTGFRIPVPAFGDVLLMKDGSRTKPDNSFGRLH